jgi:hypothetical protein
LFKAAKSAVKKAKKAVKKMKPKNKSKKTQEVETLRSNLSIFWKRREFAPGFPFGTVCPVHQKRYYFYISACRACGQIVSLWLGVTQ